MKTLLALGAAAVLLTACGQGSSDSSGQSNAAGSGAPGAAGRPIWVTGSSTVFPFTSRVAENYGQKTGRPAPRVESLGTGGGMKAFCLGVGPNTPDATNASRPMKASEYELCASNGVTEIIEIPIGYDGVVIANNRTGPAYALQLSDLYLALAAQTPGPNGGFVANPNRTWRDVRAALPADRIEAYGPPPTSGTRDSFIELGMHASALKQPILAALKDRDSDAFEQRAGALREDGGWIDSGENDNAIVQTLTRTPGSVGVFGYSFLNENRAAVKAATIDGVAPTVTAIQDGSYPLARSMFVYVKKAHLGVTPGLREFVQEYLSEASAGRGGYLQNRGLIPLPAERLAATREAFKAGTAMAKPAK